jgi:hypothetical protein
MLEQDSFAGSENPSPTNRAAKGGFSWESVPPKDKISQKEYCDLISKFIFEWSQQMRHMELLRSSLIQYIYALAAVVFGFFATLVKDGRVSSVSWFATIGCAGTLVLLGVYGWLVVWKTNERYDLATSYREVFIRAISSRTRNMGFSPEIELIRYDAEKFHYGNHPDVPRKDARSKGRLAQFMRKLRLHVAWEIMCLLVVGVGMVLVFVRALA